MTLRTTTIPLALALCAGIAPAGAQTVIQNDPVQLTPTQQTTIYRTIVRERVAPPARAAAKKDMRRSKQAQPTIRTTTRERIVTRPAPATAPVIRERVVISPPAIVDDAPIALSPDQRNLVYRSIVEQPVQPRVVITQPARQPLVTTEPDRVITTAPAVRERVIATAPTVIAPPAGERVITAPATTGLAPAATTQTLVVGERVPSWIQLYAMPPATVAAVPEIDRYNYALIDNRVFLVDPADGVVVAELYQ